MADLVFHRTDDVGYDVYLLAGQSNMAGRGMAYDAANYDPQSGRIQQYAAAGTLASTIAQAFEPLGFPDSVALGPIGMGPGLVFARWMQHATPENRRILLVPAAYGGTGFSVAYPLTWLTTGGAGGLFANAVAQANAAMVAAGPNARFSGILWVQGEQDATMNPTTYAANLDALIAGFRSQITGASATTPFVLGRMVPEFVAATSGAPAIEAAHIATPSRNAYCSIAAGVSGYDGGTALHYTAAGQRLVGRNLFTAFLSAKGATTTTALVAPSAVAALAATVISTGITLSWTPHFRTASYKVERSTDGGTTWNTLAATIYGNGYTVTTGMTAGTAIYRVTGQNAAGVGSPATVSVTLATPGQVTSLTSPSQGSSLVNLSWAAVTVGAQPVSYLIEYSTDGGTTWLPGSTVTATNGSVTGLTQGTTYKFRVTAKSGGISGTPSATLSQSTTPPVSASDAFTRADSSTTLGGSWGTPSGTWGIRSNTAYCVAQPGNGFAVAPYPVGASDGTVSIDITGTSIDTGAAGLAVRISDTANYFGFRLGGGQVQPYKIVAGATTGLAAMTYAHASSGTVTISVVMAGSTLTVKANGTTIGTITDTFNQTATNHGLWGPSVNANSSLDNFNFAG